MHARDRTLIFERRDERGSFQLLQAGPDQYELTINGVFIMASDNALSSELLVRNAVGRHGGTGLRLLIGGLGLGYSVREACRLGDAVGRITVVEIDPLVIECNRTHLLALNGRLLQDARVELVQRDFIDYVNGAGGAFDVICMDIDNGPMLIVHEGNAAAYGKTFFEAVHSRLSAGGVFVIWSCGTDDALQSEMARVFPCCFVQEVFEEHAGKPVPYYLYFGCKEPQDRGAAAR